MFPLSFSLSPLFAIGKDLKFLLDNTVQIWRVVAEGDRDKVCDVVEGRKKEGGVKLRRQCLFCSPPLSMHACTCSGVMKTINRSIDRPIDPVNESTAPEWSSFQTWSCFTTLFPFLSFRTRSWTLMSSLVCMYTFDIKIKFKTRKRDRLWI